MEPQERYSESDSEPVAAARRELAGVAARPLGEHADAFGRVHSALQHALSEIDHA